MGKAIARITDAPTSWTEYAYVIAGVPSAGVATPNKQFIDLGSVSGGANTRAAGLSLDFDANFDDSVFDVRLWMANNPRFTGHNWFMDIGAAKTFPAVSETAPLTTGIELPCSPANAPLTRWAGATMYNATDNRIQELIVQLQTDAGARIVNPQSQVYTPPVLVLDFQRMDQAISGLNTDQFSADLESGHLFTFSDVELYRIDINGCWVNLSSIREETFEISNFAENVDWRKGKPMTTVIQALSNTISEVKFQLAQETPAISGEGIDIKPVNNTKDKTIDVRNSGRKRPTIESGFALRWRSEGGFQFTFIMDRAHLTRTGPIMPGASDAFAEAEYTITALQSGCDKDVSNLTCSVVPEQSSCFIPICANVTA